MPKYLLANVYNYDNQGEMSQVISLVENLNGRFSVVPMVSKVDYKLCYKYGINIEGRLRPLPKPLFILWMMLLQVRVLIYRILPLGIFLNRELRAYRDCDMILDLSGDTFSDDPHPLQTVLHCLQLLPAIFMNKPYVLVSQSIGVFRTLLTRKLAKYVLNHARLIITRENITGRYLVQELGIDTFKVSCAVDVGYLVKPIQLNGYKDCIGVNVSQIIGRWMLDKDDYIKLMVRLIDDLSKNNKVVLIPHVTGSGYALGKSKIHDDRIIAREIYDKLSNLKRVQLVDSVYSPDITKGIISNCKFFIGARFHACLSAISQGIPTVVLAYSQKSVGIVNQIDLPWVQVVDVRNKGYLRLLGEVGCLLPR